MWVERLERALLGKRHPLVNLGLLLVASTIVGAGLSIFNVNPLDLWAHVLHATATAAVAFCDFALVVFDRSAMAGFTIAERIARYLATGLIVIAPAWLGFRLISGLLFLGRRG